MLNSFPPFQCTDFVICVRELGITLCFVYAVLKQHPHSLWIHILFTAVYREVNSTVVTLFKKSGYGTQLRLEELH